MTRMSHVLMCVAMAGCTGAPADLEVSTVQGAARAAPMMWTSPSGEALSIHDVGLPTSGTPPLGAGVAPLAGMGGDGAAAVTGTGATVGGVSGPGAVRWHGGQWIVPVSAPPGASLANVSCDVVPNSTSTDLVEVVGPAGVIGAQTVPAASGFVIRIWPFFGAWTVQDGANLVIRHSPRDVAGGAWTSATQDLTILGCYVNTGYLRTKVIAPNPSNVPSYATIDITSGIGNVTTNVDGYFVGGDRIRAIRLYVQDNTQPGAAVGYSGPTELISRFKSYAPSTGSVPTTLSTSNVSNGSGTVQVLSMIGLDVAIAGGGITHSLQTIDNIGVAPTVVWSTEIDYAPAP